MWQQFLRFAIAWVKLSWRDILTMAALGGAALGVSHPLPPTWSHIHTKVKPMSNNHPDLRSPLRRHPQLPHHL